VAESIWKKRKKALLTIAALSGTNIAFTGAPKPTLEIPSQIALTGSDFAMCAAIHYEYFGERISKEQIIETLGLSGLLVLVVSGAGYGIAKVASGAIAELTNFLGPLGWMASGLLAAGGTATLGLIWMAIVDYAYRKRVPMSEAATSFA
jgi:hypothetical protein